MTPDETVSPRLVLDRARELTAMVQGRSRGDLGTDRMFQLAVTRLIGLIGEGAARLDIPVYGRSPETIWPDVVAEFDTVDDDLIWNLATMEVPALIAVLEREPR